MSLATARRQALLEAAVKFDPQQRVLVQALGQQQSNALQTIQSARGTASALVAAINAARPQLARGYADASQTASAARGDLLGHLAGLGPAAAPFSAAVAREQAGTTSRAAQERANALGELTLRGVQAREGGVSAELNARRQLASNEGQILSQLAGVAADKGAFGAAQLGSIQQADRQVASQNQRARISAGATVRSARIRSAATVQAAQTRASASAAKAAQARGRVTPTQSAGAVNQLRVAVDTIKKLGPAIPSSALRGYLQDGYTTAPSFADATGKPVPAGTPGSRRVPGTGGTRIPQIKGAGPVAAHDLINAAFDIARFGTLSPANRRALARVHLPAEWRRPLPRPSASVAAAAVLGHAR